VILAAASDTVSWPGTCLADDGPCGGQAAVLSGDEDRMFQAGGAKARPDRELDDGE
jgi:hypothetical protein